MFHRLFLFLITIYRVKLVTTLSTSVNDAEYLCQYKTTLDSLEQKSDLSYRSSMLTQASLENLQHSQTRHTTDMETIKQTLDVLIENQSGIRTIIQNLLELVQKSKSSCTLDGDSQSGLDEQVNQEEEGHHMKQMAQDLALVQSELLKLKRKIEYQENILDEQNTKITIQEQIIWNLTSSNDENGVVFTRWGRTDCPLNISIPVYSGFAGGSYYQKAGGAAEYVCLPPDPTWGEFKDHAYNDKVGQMYGAEYHEPYDMFRVPNSQVDAPCSVCIGIGHSLLIMIPGRINCYDGWTELYHGNLATNHFNYWAASEYVCVDESPQATPGSGNVSDNGKLFHGVKTVCGSLPCPPYENDKFLSCVVCMK